MPRRTSSSLSRAIIESLEERRLLAYTNFAHPGILSTDADSTRMATLVEANAGSNTLALATTHAFIHPSVPTTLQELDTIKANLDKEPWKSGYAYLAGSISPNYTMKGPFATVSRTPDVNLSQWKNDMGAVHSLALMWYFTGNTAYAQKAHDILLAWATTQTSFGGQEMALSIGDYAGAYVGGADLLRGTWPGWTAADTTTVKNYFLNLYWPACYAGFNTIGPANKGALTMAAGIAIAAFCDDTAKFNHVIDNFRTLPASGLTNTLPTGEIGETGRDQGHSFNTLSSMAFIAEVAWKQGIDLYSELDNRLLACGEYYARNTLMTDNPFVPFGSIDYTYYGNNGDVGTYTANRGALYLIQNAYKNRKGLPTPWIDLKLQSQPVDGGNWLVAKTADFTTATPLPDIVRPAVSVASSGLTLTQLGTTPTVGSLSYANGVTTITGTGWGVWGATSDNSQFAYKTMTGDCALVGKVTSWNYSGNTAGEMGLMLRDNLNSTVSQRAWIAFRPTSTGDNLLDSYQAGWTDNWGGSNWAHRSQTLPLPLPYWLKIERIGNHINTYTSQDGANWAPITSSYYGNGLPSTVYIGLFISTGTTTDQTGTFENVAFTGGSGGLVTTPAAPAAVFASGSSKVITVRWVPSFGATSYDLLRSTTSGSGYAAIASNLSTTTTSYVDTTAVAGTTYYYVVQAKNSIGTSGNSPQFSASRLTSPMVNLAFGGTANSSTIGAPWYETADQAFNSDPKSKWYNGNAGNPSPTGWLRYDFGGNNSQVIKRYTVNSADVANRNPKDWQFQGSQDGSTWTTLDTQSNQSFADLNLQKIYNIGNTTAYRYYQINVTANNGASTLAIAELGLWGDTGRTIPDGTYLLGDRQSHKVIDLAAGGAPALQQSWNGGNTQQWAIAWQGNGVYRVTNVSSGKVLDNGGTSNPGSNVAVNTWSGANSQLWKIVPDSDGYYHFTSANSALVMDVSGGSSASGANIVQSAYTGGDSQLWMPGFAAAPQPIPPAPTGLVATAASISQINLSWTASPGAISYTIKRATVSGGPYSTVATGINTTSYSDTYLNSSTTYYYVVSAVNGSGESADSAQSSATTLTGAPDAPTGLTALLGTNQAILNWTVTAGATSYIVKRATTSGGPYTTVANNVTSTTYTDSGLLNGVTYYYVVVAANADGQSGYSNEVNVTPSDLVAQLKFDEGSGTTAYDATGNNWPGTLVNGPVWNSSGRINGDVTLDGTDDYVSLPTGVVNGLTAVTISAWVNLATVATWQRIFDFGTGTSNYMFLSPKNGATSKVRFAITTSGTGGEQFIDGTGALPVGVWTHVVVTINGAVGTFYINGTQVGQKTNMTLNPSSLGNTTRNYIGKSQFSDPLLNGQVDDFRIYNRALTSTQVSALASTTRPAAPTNLTASGGIAEASLTWSAVSGASGYNVLRSTSAMGPFVPVAAHVGVASYVDSDLAADRSAGTTYYYIVTAENAVGDSPFSTAASTLVTPQLAAAPQGLTATAGISGKINLAWTAGADAAAYSVQRALSADGPFTTIAANIVPASYTDTGLTNGLNYYYTVTATNFSGTGSESDPVSASATDLVARLKFDSASGTVAADATGHGYDGTLVNSATWSTGKIGQAVSLNGSSQYVSLPTGVMSGLTTATLAGWVYLNSATANQRIFDFGSGTGINMFLTNAGGTAVRFAITTGGNGGEQTIVGTSALPTGSWVHVAVTLSGAVGTLYVNGTQVGQKTNMTLTPSSLGNTTQNWLGRSQYAADAYLNGKLDDFRIYSRALNSTEIGKLVAATVPATPTNVVATGGNAQVVLNWSAASGATSYTILRSVDQNTFDPIAAGITSTSWTNVSVTNGTTYAYQVVAVNTNDSSNPSETVTATPTGIPTTFNGTGSADAYYLRRAGSLLQVWLNATDSGTPDYSDDYGSLNSLSFSGLGGDDQLVLDGSAGDPIPSGGINFDGGTGNDIVSIIGSGAADSFAIGAADQITHAGKTVAYSNAEKLSLSAGIYSINSDLSGKNLQVSGIATQVTFTKSQNLGSLTVDTGASLTSASTEAGMPAILADNVMINNGLLSISPNGNQSGVSKFSNLTITGTGKIDLHDNDLVIDFGNNISPYLTIRQYVKYGLELLGGNGFGIGSSDVDNQTKSGTVLGLIDNSMIDGSITTLSNYSDFSSNSILIKFTWFGDSNFDGKVDGSDYALADTGFTSGGELSGWIFGDSNFNDVVEGDDYALIDSGFIAQNSIL